jgi:hypothetical protein
MGSGGQRHAPAALSPGRPGTHCVGGWVGHRAGLDRCGKSRISLGLDPRTVHPVASHYTDYTIPAPGGKGVGKIPPQYFLPKSGFSGYRFDVEK